MSDDAPPKTPPDEPPPRSDLDLGLQFVHLLAMQNRFDTVQALGAVFALIEELAAKGMLDLRSLDERRQRATVREAERANEDANVKLSAVEDKYALKDLPEIDCASLIPICQARCCTMGVTLSRQDLDERIVRWEYAQPYQIRRRRDQYCCHNEEATRSCQVHEHRPAACRVYDCRKDKRIWLDFEKRILAPLPEDG
jgi:Fe-S-cluster containining protein